MLLFPGIFSTIICALEYSKEVPQESLHHNKLGFLTKDSKTEGSFCCNSSFKK